MTLYGFDVHVYTSHYHAEYDRDKDAYLGHRVVHALESAQWIKLASSSADLTIYSGDFNTEPGDVPYALVRAVAPLEDAWLARHGDESGGQTCDVPSNSFARPTTQYPEGKRIDYVMYQPGPNVSAETIHCALPLPSRVPGEAFSYSDHEAVTATIRLRRECAIVTASDYRRQRSVQARGDCVRAVAEALAILRKSRAAASDAQTRHQMAACVLLILIVASFIPLAVLPAEYHAVLELSLFLPRFLLTVALLFSVLMATIFAKREQHGLSSARRTLQLIHDQDILPMMATEPESKAVVPPSS